MISETRVPNITADLATMLDSSLGYFQARAESAQLGSDSRLDIETNSIKNNCIIKFYAKIDTFSAVRVGHGESGNYQQSFEIDDTNVYYIVGQNRTAIAHNLTIASYIAVTILVEKTCAYTIIVDTLSGRWQRRLESAWLGTKGSVFAKSIDSVLSNAILTWSADYQKSKWAFGDSYFSMGSSARWPYWLIHDGFDNTLFNGFPGEGAADALTDLENALGFGSPRYVIWCLGMNNGDTSSAINDTWKTETEQVMSLCAARGITLILATTPNTPTVRNTYKNDYVKQSGYRYIDFAEAVGAESADSTWLPGCLSSDNVHPTEAGARLLYLRAVQDFPEFMQK